MGNLEIFFGSYWKIPWKSASDATANVDLELQLFLFPTKGQNVVESNASFPMCGILKLSPP